MSHRFPSWRDTFPKIPPHKTAADKILSGAFGFKLEGCRCRDDDDGEPNVILQYEITGSIDNAADAKELLRALLAEFNTPATEGGVA